MRAKSPKNPQRFCAAAYGMLKIKYLTSKNCGKNAFYSTDILGGMNRTLRVADRNLQDNRICNMLSNTRLLLMN